MVRVVVSRLRVHRSRKSCMLLSAPTSEYTISFWSLRHFFLYCTADAGMPNLPPNFFLFLHSRAPRLSGWHRRAGDRLSRRRRKRNSRVEILLWCARNPSTPYTADVKNRGGPRRRGPRETTEINAALCRRRRRSRRCHVIYYFPVLPRQKLFLTFFHTNILLYYYYVILYAHRCLRNLFVL